MKNAFTRWVKPAAAAVSIFGLLLALGCGDSQIKTYRVAKEDNTPKIPNTAAPSAGSAESGAQPSMAGAHATLPAPNISWSLPKGWKELPAGGMRKAAFEIVGEGGQSAQVTVIPLPGTSNIELETVNMWRAPFGLAELNKDQAAAAAAPVQLGDTNGHLFDMLSTQPEPTDKSKSRLLGAVADRAGVVWVIKMTGPDGLVESQKPAFVDFLKSLKFEQASPTQLAATEAPVTTNTKRVPSDAEGPKFKAPANWQQKAPGPMITAAYAVTGGEGQADVTISKFPGDVGGLAANVNRWRGQLGLAPLGEAEAQQSAQMVEIDGKKNAYMVDLKGTSARTGKQARMVALGVPRGGETWFYKLIGDDAVVAKEKDTFLKFVTSAY